MKSLQIENRTLFKKFDLNLIFVIVAISIIGLINLFSATHDVQNTTNQLDQIFLTQVVWFAAGFSIFGILTILDYKILSKLAYVMYGLNVLALAAVPIIGKSFYGAKRWIDLGFFKYQPSETMKIILIILLAKIFSQKSYPHGLGFKNLILPLILIMIPFSLTVKQPDLGTGMMILFSSFSIIFFVGIKRNVLITALAVILVVVPVTWKFGLKDYQKNRIHTFMDPNTDPRGAGYNSIQSKIAVGSGKFFGKGFRKGTQSQLNFLPEHHTDFIFSVLSEENGFVGSVTTLLLFVILIVISLKIASQARDKFGALIVVGGASIVFWHAFINIGMVIGLLPIVGIPLPLMSYGGSIMITTMTCLGLISSVSIRKFIF